MACEGGPPAGIKLANLEFPPPPIAGTSGASGSPQKIKARPSSSLGSCHAELDAATNSALSPEMQNRSQLWAVRAEIEKEKLKMVAPFPFFGHNMRFEDDFAALQITEDGRFSFSEMCVVNDNKSPDDEPVIGKMKAPVVRRIITYEGIFDGPHLPAPEEDHEQPAAGGQKKKEASSGKAKSKDAEAEEAPGQAPCIAGIEATARVKHEIIDSGGRTRLVNVERGCFRFAIIVSPCFGPDHAILKVLTRCGKIVRGGRRMLQYVGVGPCLASEKRVLSQSSSLTLLPRTAAKNADGRMKNSRSTGLLPGLAMRSGTHFTGSLIANSGRMGSTVGFQSWGGPKQDSWYPTSRERSSTATSDKMNNRKLFQTFMAA